MRISLPNNWTPRWYQRKAWDYLEKGGKHAELIWHRRSGKDEIALHRTACAAFERPANYWHMLPEYAQARKAIWSAVNPRTGRRRVDEAFPHELRKTTREDTMEIVFKNGATWQVVGSDSYNKLVGSTPVGIVYSEWALSNPSAKAYLRPILLENGGWQMFISTPRGKNHAFRTFKSAQTTPGAFAELLTAYDTQTLTPGQLEQEKQAYIDDFGPDMGLAMFEQEYECNFDAAILGAVLGKWIGRARKAGRMQEGVYDPKGAPVCISSDIGFRDTSSWWFWQPRIDGFGLVGYLGASGMDADDWIEKLKEYISARRMKLGQIWLPHDARNKTFSAKHSPLERFLKAFDHVDIVPMTKIEHRINAGRRVIERCYFDETECADGIDGLTSWAYEYDEETRTFSKEPKHDWASHPGDGFTYGAQMMEMLSPPPPPPEPMRGITVGANTATLDELWKTAKMPSKRI